ncbi:hypothetical protein, partial [Pseudomonas fluorescens]
SLSNSGQRGLTGRLRSRADQDQERLASHRGYLWVAHSTSLSIERPPSQASQLPHGVGAAANSVGASLLAKNVNDNPCLLNERGASEFFASKLAPTKKP